MELISFLHNVHYCSTLGGIHGVPRVHYKGRQGDYYVMVIDNMHRISGYAFLLIVFIDVAITHHKFV